MKTIESITVKTSFTVGLGDVKVPDKIHKQLNEIANNCIDLNDSDLKYPEVAEWMRDNIKIGDCYNCVYEIEDLY